MYLTQPGEQLVNCGRATVVSPSTKARVKPFQQLRPFLEDGQVGGEVRVEDLVEAAAAQGGVQLEGQRRAGRKAETLADGRPRTGRRLNDHVPLGVVDGGPDVVRGVVGLQGAGGAAVAALPAVDADHVGQRLLQEGGDARAVAAADRLQHADLLEVDARADAAAAEDALVDVPHDGVAGRVDLVARRLGAAEAVVIDAVLRGQRLEFAMIVPHAGAAVAHVEGRSRSSTCRRARRTSAVCVGTWIGAVIG